MTGKIRVMHIITGLEMAGSQILLHKLLSSMDQSRFDSAVISLADDGGAIGPHIVDIGIPVHALNMKGLWTGLLGFNEATALIRKFKPHVIQTWLHHADLFGTVAARLCGYRNVVWNLQCASLSPGDVRRRNLLLVKLLGRLSTLPRAVVSISDAGRLAHAAAGYRPRRWEIVPNGFDTALFAPDTDARRRVRGEFGIDDQTPVVGIIGRYHPMKGHALFVQAAKVLLQRRPDVVFVMAGMGIDDRNRELVEQIASNGLGQNIRMVGVWPKVCELMNAFDLLALSSTSEGFPTVIGEAMACGIPCVATDVGDCRSIIGETGRVVAGDAVALASAWEEVLALPVQERQRLGAAARERICLAYSIGGVVRSYEGLYEEMANLQVGDLN